MIHLNQFQYELIDLLKSKMASQQQLQEEKKLHFLFGEKYKIKKYL